MKTQLINKDDVLKIAYDIKVTTNDKLVEKVLNEYDEYSKQYPTDNWSEIVENMLYDFTNDFRAPQWGESASTDDCWFDD